MMEKSYQVQFVLHYLVAVSAMYKYDIILNSPLFLNFCIRMESIIDYTLLSEKIKKNHYHHCL